MDYKPLVSIVTPSFNQAEFLENTIKSVLEQDYPNIEYFVMDGGSNDGSVEIIKKYNDKITYWVSEKDKGQSDAINKGWKLSKGSILCYLNSDDFLAPGAISKVVKYFNLNRDAAIIHGDCIFIDTQNKQLGAGKGASTSYKQLLINGQYRYIFQPSSFYNSELVKKAGYIDESLHLSMDYDLLVKLSKLSYSVYIPENLSFFRLHKNTKSSTLAERHWRETLSIIFRQDRFLILKPFFRYLRFRMFNSLPVSLKMFIRKKRNSVNDWVLIENQP